MRLIGNKTKLLGAIEGFLRERQACSGTLIDVFSGTASVGRHFKQLGLRVFANDSLGMCYTQAVAQIEVSREPAFRRWRASVRRELDSATFRRSLRIRLEKESGASPAGGDGTGEDAPSENARPLAEAIHYYSSWLEPCEGIVFRSFCPGGTAGRQYFTDENGRRIDAVLERLRADFRAGLLETHELHLVLAALIDGADRVANISGTYGAFLKRFQTSALRPIELRTPAVLESPLRHRAFREDANQLVRSISGDVLYIDPPYNQRQYAANYHVLEILAEYPTVEDPAAYEGSFYGKTGLLPYREKRSLYCVKPSRQAIDANVVTAMTDLILSARVKHVLVSYNEEGLLSREELGSILARFAGDRSFDFDVGMRDVLHRRFRSDGDRAGDGQRSPRRYRVIDGKQRDEVSEWLFFASRGGVRGRSRGRGNVPSEAGLS